MDTALPSADTLHRCLADRPADADALHRLGVLAGQRGDAAAGMRSMLRANAVRPADGAALVEAVSLLPTLWRDALQDWREERRDAAAQRLDLLLALPAAGLAMVTNVDVVLRQILEIAAALHGSGRLDEAARLYRGLLVHRPDLPEAQHLLGATEWRRGLVVQGIERIAEALRRHPEQEGARLNLKTALDEAWAIAAEREREGRLDEAAAIRRTLRHRPLTVAKDAFGQWGEVEFQGLHLRLPAGDFTYHACRLGRYEPHVMREFLAALRPGMTVVDVGANVGLFALLAARAVGPRGRVYAIEALGRNAKIIRINCELNGLDNIHLIPIGLSDRTGADMWMTQNENTNNMLFDLTRVAELPFDGFELIGVAPLDGLLPPDTRVDVIKIDIEGREHKALLGARGILERCRPVIFSEYSPAYLRRTSGIEGRDYLNFLTGLGYDVDILHKEEPVEAVPANGPEPVADHVDATWERECAGGGTHLDLRFRPRQA